MQLALDLARGLAKLHRADVEARNAAGPAGSPERAAFQESLSGAELARLHLVLGATARQLTNSRRGEWGQQLAQARGGYGCRTCGAIGLEDCYTSSGHPVPRTHGSWGPRWHACADSLTDRNISQDQETSPCPETLASRSGDRHAGAPEPDQVCQPALAGDLDRWHRRAHAVGRRMRYWP